jgi:hypothetical protein
VKSNAESSGFFGRLNIISQDSDERVANWVEPDLSVLRERFLRKIQPLEYQEAVVTKEPEAIEMLEKWYVQARAGWLKQNLSDDITSRIQVMVNRNACHLAWLLSGDDITPNPEKANEPIEVCCDEDIMRRAIALAEYQVKARLLHRPAAGKNDWAVMEGLVRQTVQTKGAITRSKLFREIRADAYGIQAFNKAIENLVLEGIIKVGQYEGETKRGRKAQIIMWCDD